MSENDKPTPGWAQGCAASVVIFLAAAIVFGAGLLAGWLIWR